MEQIVRVVSFRVWDESRQDFREYSGSIASEGKVFNSDNVEVFVDGETFEISKEDVPLLIKVLKEFC